MRIFVRILLGVVALLAVLVVGAAVVIATIDKRALLAPLEARLEKATGREVTVGGEPRIDLSLTPTLVLEDVAIANAPWGSAKEMLRAKRVEAQVALLPLLSRRIELMRFTLVEPGILLETDRSGAGNWSFGASAAAPAAPAAPADVTAASAFALGEFVIERGEVRYRDGRTGEATPIVVERLYVRGRDPQQPLVAQFRGRVADLPVDVEGTFGPLAALQAGRWPWPVSLEGEVAGRRTGVQAKVRPDAGGIAAGDVVLVRGASRLTGSVAYQPREGRKPLWRFDLAAPVLQAGDLALAAPATVAATAGPRDGRLFPATPVAFDALRAADAQGTLAVESLVLEDGRRFGPLRAKIALDAGRLVVDDLALGAYGGTTRGRIVVDARAAPASIALRLDGRALDLGALLAAAGLERSVQGAKTDVTLDVTMRGGSPRAWASSLTGPVVVSVGGGTIVPGTQGLGTPLLKALDAIDPMRAAGGPTRLACAVVRLPLRDGVARVDRSIALQTDQLGASASGTVDLRNETVDLSVAPRLRVGVSVDLAKLAGAVRIRGSLADPGVTIDPLGAVAAAADVRALVREGPAALLRGGGLVATSPGNECAVALGTARPEAAPAPGAVPPPGRSPAPRDPARDVEQALRKLLGR